MMRFEIIFKNMIELDTLKVKKAKSFEQRSLNRSITDLLIYEKMADFLLKILPSSIHPNTLSILSCLFPMVSIFFVISQHRLCYALTAVMLLLHQLLDIANKKQAHRLNIFSLKTYFIDHLCDSFSASAIVFTISVLIGFQNNKVIVFVGIFALLPFYLHHLVMYHTGYLDFPLISPTSQGFLFLDILCLVCLFIPNLPSTQIVSSFLVKHLILIIASIWLLIFVISDLMALFKKKYNLQTNESTFQKTSAWKHFYIILPIGYLIFEMIFVTGQLLNDSRIFFFFFFILNVICNEVNNNIILSLGYGNKYTQISCFFLIITGLMALFFCFHSWILKSDDNFVQIIILSLLLAISQIFFCVSTFKNIKEIDAHLAS